MNCIIFILLSFCIFHAEKPLIHLKSGVIPPSNSFLSFSDSELNSNLKQQFIISLKYILPTTIDLLKDYSKTLNYIPYNSYIVFITPTQLVQLQSLSIGIIGVQRVPLANKIDTKILSNLALSNNHDHEDYIIKLIEPFEELDSNTIKTLEPFLYKNSINKNKYNNDIISMRLTTSQLSQIIYGELGYNIEYIQKKPDFHLANYYARYSIQSGLNDIEDSKDMAQAYQHGIDGTNEIISIGDTGIDYDHCLFYDEGQEVPTTPSVNLNHRKVVSYGILAPGDTHGDTLRGHGSHVVGTTVGSVKNSSYFLPEDVTNTSQFNGVASGAKVVFWDISPDGASLFVPDDFEADYFLPHYDIGARIASNSWGGDGDYEIFCFLTDRFCHNHPDFLPLFAAGNAGEHGSFTISTPAAAKNVIAVGASQSSSNSFLRYGFGLGFKVHSPSSLIGYYDALPANFGRPWSSLSWMNRTLVISDPLEACSGLTFSVPEHAILLVKRGSCYFSEKVTHVTNAGAEGVLIFNNINGANIIMAPGSPCDSCVPAAMITLSLGTSFSDKNVSLSIPEAVPPSGKMSLEYLASFSSRGPAYDGRIKPDILSIGQHLMSCSSDALLTSHQCGLSSLTLMEGTSMATPVAAGSVALIRQYFRDGYYPTGVKTPSDGFNPSASLLKAAAINSGEPILEDKFPPTYNQGFGRMTLNNFFNFKDNFTHNLYIMNEEISFTSINHTSFCVDINDLSVPFKVTLVWTDEPSSLSSTTRLVNDLDLSIISEYGIRYIGNNVPLRDELNNVEQIWFSNSSVENGLYLITVAAHSLPKPPQSFSLVINGNFSILPLSECTSTTDFCSSTCVYGNCTLESNNECVCDDGFYGPYCDIPIFPLELSVETVNTTVDRGWNYYSFFLDESYYNNFTNMQIRVNRIGGFGDPDIYVDIDSLPTLRSHLVSEIACDPCGYTVHQIDLNQTFWKNNAYYYIGIFAYPPDSTTTSIKIELNFGNPPNEKGFFDNLPTWALALIGIGATIGITLCVFYIINHFSGGNRNDTPPTDNDHRTSGRGFNLAVPVPDPRPEITEVSISNSTPVTEMQSVHDTSEFKHSSNISSSSNPVMLSCSENSIVYPPVDNSYDETEHSPFIRYF